MHEKYDRVCVHAWMGVTWDKQVEKGVEKRERERNGSVARVKEN